jgi:hypothetical protein
MCWEKEIGFRHGRTMKAMYDEWGILYACSMDPFIRVVSVEYTTQKPNGPDVDIPSTGIIRALGK